MTVFQLCFAPLCFLLAAMLLLRPAMRFALSWKNVLWAFLWLFGGIMIVWPNATAYAASFMGIGRGTDLMLYVGAFSALYAFQCLYRRIRELEIMLTAEIRQQTINAACFIEPGPSVSDADQASR